MASRTSCPNNVYSSIYSFIPFEAQSEVDECKTNIQIVRKSGLTHAYSILYNDLSSLFQITLIFSYEYRKTRDLMAQDHFGYFSSPDFFDFR